MVIPHLLIQEPVFSHKIENGGLMLMDAHKIRNDVGIILKRNSTEARRDCAQWKNTWREKMVNCTKEDVVTLKV